MKRYQALLLTLSIFISPLMAKLETPLKDNGGHHFRFEGTKYILTMDTDGKLYFTSKKLDSSAPNDAKANRIRMGFGSREIKPNNFKWVSFNKMETQFKQSSSKFTLIMKGEMETGVKFVSKIEGSKSKVMLITDMTRPDKVSFHMGFHVPKAPEDFQKKGLIVKLDNKKKKHAHQCSKPYDTSHYKTHCRQVLVQNRNPLSLIFDSGKAEGYFTVVQHSHHQGAVLNEPFSIYYHNGEKNWKASKNTFVFSF